MKGRMNDKEKSSNIAAVKKEADGVGKGVWK
jgi:hypothetical protein